MARPNGKRAIKAGSIRFKDPATASWVDISPFVTNVTMNVSGWQTARDDVLDGPLLGVGPRGEDSVTVTGIYTIGETANPQGDWYKIVWAAFKQADCKNLPVEISDLSAATCDPAGAQPFDAADPYWYTTESFSRVTSATPPEMTRSGATSKTVQFTVSTELIDQKDV